MPEAALSHFDGGNVCLGFGFHSKATEDEIFATVFGFLQSSTIWIDVLASLQKASCYDGLFANLEKRLNRPILRYSAHELETMTPRLLTPSEHVFKAVGCHGVAEAAALKAAGQNTVLIMAKKSVGNVTLALAKSEAQ